jgi:hypothetical protein
MVETIMLLVALVAFAGLLLGWMIFPDAPVAEGPTSSVIPSSVGEPA